MPNSQILYSYSVSKKIFFQRFAAYRGLNVSYKKEWQQKIGKIVLILMI